MKTLASLAFALMSLTCLSQVIYTSEISIPSFNFLNTNNHCVSNEDLSLFNDTTLNFYLLSQGREGVVYFAYSSVFGNITQVNYEQIYQGQTIAFDNYIFLGLNDTIQIQFTIFGNNIESFCPFFLPLNPLVVVFGEIDCIQYSTFIIASCQTLSETNSQRIELQISSDLISWEVFDTKQTFVNSSSENVYKFKSDKQLQSGMYYAKFVEFDLNGSTTESEIIPFEYKLIEVKFDKYDLAGRRLK